MSLKALYAAATGMDAQQTRIDNIANNLANVNTTGYKASRESFEDLIYDQVQAPGAKTGSSTITPVGVQIGHGTKLTGVFKQFSQGELSQTNRELDISVEGNGFFQVTLDNGEKAFTRDGSLSLDKDGNLVTKNGLKVEPAVTVPAEALSLAVAKDGTISVTVPGQGEAQSLGTLQLTLFKNPAGLQNLGQNLYKETEASGTATTVNPNESGAGQISQGFLENSNVNVAEELINMIVAQRMYEANSKVMSTTSEMMRASNSVV